ncbi:hypothetical protein GF373_02275 [bacterium]|nr:hypothetical protein [bacterium]
MSMKSVFSVFMLFVLLASPGFAATITVARDGSGDMNSVQLAVATMADGDEIVILDSAVYEEDLTGGAGAGFAGQFTLKAAEGQTPTIRAVNEAERLESIGAPGVDYLGAFFSGCVGVVIEGIVFENFTTDVNVLTISSALAFMDCNDVTVRNCTIRGAGGPGTAYGGFNFGLLVSGQTMASAGMVFENCLVEECHYGVQVLKAAEGVPADPSITLRGCTIQNCNGNGIEIDCAAQPEPVNPNRQAAGEGHRIEDTLITNCQNPLTLGGGKIVVRNCTILGNRGYINVDKQSSGELPILVEFDQTAIVGSENIGVRVVGGRLTMTHCIVAGCYNEGIYITENAEEAIVVVDHCDFYRNLIMAPESFELRLETPFELERTLTMTNTNVIGVAGILNGSMEDFEDYIDGLASASYCNVLTEYEAFSHVDLDHVISEDPLYVNPSAEPATFTREGFKLREGSPVLTAGSGGSYIGSQGPVQTGILDWMMF